MSSCILHPGVCIAKCEFDNEFYLGNAHVQMILCGCNLTLESLGIKCSNILVGRRSLVARGRCWTGTKLICNGIYPFWKVCSVELSQEWDWNTFLVVHFAFTGLLQRLQTPVQQWLPWCDDAADDDDNVDICPGNPVRCDEWLDTYSRSTNGRMIAM